MGVPDKIITEKCHLEVTVCLTIQKKTLNAFGIQWSYTASIYDSQCPWPSGLSLQKSVSRKNNGKRPLLEPPRPPQSQLSSLAKWSFYIFCLDTLNNQSLTLQVVYSLQYVDTFLCSSRKLFALVSDFQENEENILSVCKHLFYFWMLETALVAVSRTSWAKLILASPAQSVFALQPSLLSIHYTLSVYCYTPGKWQQMYMLEMFGGTSARMWQDSFSLTGLWEEDTMSKHSV